MSADPIVYCLEHLTDYRQFERLCTDIMSQSGYEDIEPLGGTGDGGRDALHVSRCTDVTTIFAYSVRSDWEKKLLKEDCKRIEEEKHVLDELVFACTSSISATERDSVTQKVLDGFGWRLKLFSIERLRVKLAGHLRHLVAQHPATFSPTFFPRSGGLSTAESHDTLVIDHHESDHALATWLARKLQLEGYRVWSYGTAPLAGENANESILALIDKRASRYLPLLSQKAIDDPEFLARCNVANSKEHLVIPCYSDLVTNDKLPSKLRSLSGCRFHNGWSIGLSAILDALTSSAIEPPLDKGQGVSVALRSFVPEPVTKSVEEPVYANVFAASVPNALVVCPLQRQLSAEEIAELRKTWAFVIADSTTLLAFAEPPESVPLEPSPQLAKYSWAHYEFRYNKPSRNVVKELIRRSLDVACVRAGLEWCDNRKKFSFVCGDKPQFNVSYRHVDGRNTWVAVTGQKTYGSGERASPFRYQLCPVFWAGQDESGNWWVTLRIYVRVTDLDGIPYEKKAIGKRRKVVCKNWWNKEWFARTLAIMQALENTTSQIVVGECDQIVSVSTAPLTWDCPVALDYEALERIGDFQLEMSELRYYDDDEDDDDSEGDDLDD